MPLEVDLRSGDNDLRIHKLLLELAVLALLVGSGHESVTLVLNPLPDAELVLGRAQQVGLLLGVLVALEDSVSCNSMHWSSSNVQLTSYKHRRTLPCREEVDVSVLTPPKLVFGAKPAPLCAKRCESRELAGRAARRAERANTIVQEWRERSRRRLSKQEVPMEVYVAGASQVELPSSFALARHGPISRSNVKASRPPIFPLAVLCGDHLPWFDVRSVVTQRCLWS